MKRCFLKFGDGEPQAFEVEIAGHAHELVEGTECRAKGQDIFVKGWYRVRIGAKVDHLGTRTNPGGAVYAATVLSRPEDPQLQGKLF